MESAGPDPGHRNASSTRGGVVLVSLYSWTVITLVVAMARFIIGWMHRVRFGYDDGMILCSSIIYVGATISWQYAVDGGLGKPFAEVSPDKAVIYFKSAYAAQMLHIAAMAFAKLSSAFHMGRVAPQSRNLRTVLFGSIGFWATYSLLAFAFQCGPSSFWRFDLSKCAHGGLSFSIIGLNILSDVILGAWIFPVLRPLDMDKDKRRALAALFGARLVVPLAAMAQLWAVEKAVRGDDPTYDSLDLAVLDQTITSLSLIVANLPRIHRLLGAAGSGINVPIIHETEIALSTRQGSRPGNELKLVPSNSTKFTTSVMSGGDKKEKDGKERNNVQHEWQKFVSMGSKQDDHTSTSSLFEHGGVMMQQEVSVRIEENSRPDS